MASVWRMASLRAVERGTCPSGGRPDCDVRAGGRYGNHAVLDESSGNVIVPFSLLEAHTSYVSEGWRDGEPERDSPSGSSRRFTEPGPSSRAGCSSPPTPPDPPSGKTRVSDVAL